MWYIIHFTKTLHDGFEPVSPPLQTQEEKMFRGYYLDWSLQEFRIQKKIESSQTCDLRHWAWKAFLGFRTHIVGYPIWNMMKKRSFSTDISTQPGLLYVAQERQGSPFPLKVTFHKCIIFYLLFFFYRKSFASLPGRSPSDPAPSSLAISLSKLVKYSQL